MFHLRRFQWKRKAGRACAAARAAMMIITGSRRPGTGQTDPTAAPSASRRGAPTPSVKLEVKRHVMAGNAVKIRGTVTPGRRAAGSSSRSAARRSRPSGPGKTASFQVRWQAPARRRSTRSRRSCRARTSAEPRRLARRQINVYRAAQASYYGPGLYGNSTACGRTLTPSTLGVANKSLPCGTKVTFRYRGRTVARPGDRPRPVRGQPRVGPDRRHQGEARVRLAPATCSAPRSQALRPPDRARAARGALRRAAAPCLGCVEAPPSAASPATPTPIRRTGSCGSKRSSSSRATARPPAGVAGGGREGPRAGVGLEGPQADLQRHRAARVAVPLEALADRLAPGGRPSRSARRGR